MLNRQQEHIIFAKNSKTKKNRREVKENRLFLPFKFFSGETMAPVSHMHCNSPIQTSQAPAVFLSWFLLREPQFPNSCVCEDLYIPRIGPNISSSRKGRPIVGIYNSLTDTWMGNWNWGPDIPFLGIFVSNSRHFVFAVMQITIKWRLVGAFVLVNSLWVGLPVKKITKKNT